MSSNQISALKANRIFAYEAKSKSVSALERIEKEKKLNELIDKKLDCIFDAINLTSETGGFYHDRYISESDKEVLPVIIKALNALGYECKIFMDEDHESFVKISWELS